MLETSEQLWHTARQLMPGGVNSPVRSFRQVGGVPRFIERAAGCRLFDVEGTAYIDYIGSWGAMIAGHGHPMVVEAICEAARCGTSFGTPSPLEIQLAEEIMRRMPSIEMIRMVNSGTEAVMSALRVARAATGRSRVIMFEGCYHGHVDALLVKGGSGLTMLGQPSSAGVTAGNTQDTLIARYNDLDSVARYFERFPDSIAAIIVEPIAGNMGVVPAEPGFLEGLRTITSDHGSLLILDEVMTGFRVAPGGAQSLYKIVPDLTTLGKIIGGGLPVGAYGGRREIMNLVAPLGSVYQAGTLSGNPVAMAAGLATLRLLDDNAHLYLEMQSARLESAICDLLKQAGREGTVQRVGSMLTLFLGRGRVQDFADANSADHGAFAKFFQAMLAQGVHLPPSGYEAWFVSLAHDDASITRTVHAIESSLNAD